MKTNNKNTDTMKMTSSAYADMVNYIASQPAESGGAFFGDESDNVIRKFVADLHAKSTFSSYTMDTPFLNEKIKEEWERHRLSLLGIAHAHPYGHPNLSGPDKKYFEELQKYMPREKFYTPILFTIPDGGLKVFPYVYEKGSSTPKTVELEIVSDDYKVEKEVKPPKESKSKTTNNIVLVFPQHKEKQPEIPSRTTEILLVVLSVALIYSAVFFTTLQIIPVFIQSFFKIITLWN